MTTPTQGEQVDQLASASPIQSKVTASEYAKAVYEFAALKSGIGHKFHHIAELLNSGPGPSVPIDTSQQDFVSIYEICREAEGNATLQRIPSWSMLQRSLARPDEHSTHIIFLKGFPSSADLCHVGAIYGLDPEFFRRHCDFLASSEGSSHFSSATLPSTFHHMFHLCISTVQTAERLSQNTSGSKQLRQKSDTAMNQYRNSLAQRRIRSADPIVRHFSVLDDKAYTIEQRLSVYIHVDGKRWTILIWTDCSKDVSRDAGKPWSTVEGAHSWKPVSSANVFLHPITKYRPCLALKPHLLDEATSQIQSASTIHLDYGRSLKPDVMICDSTYALREIFEFVGQAELQFLQLCDVKLDEFENINFTGDLDRPADLQNLKQVLYRHLLQNQDAESILHVMSSDPSWPKATDPRMRIRTDRSLQSLKEDFGKLTRMTEQLYNRCTATIGLLTNELVILEAREARHQAVRLGKLTFLAFIFVPLSFTTSFFGMNVRELGADQTSLSIWVWFVLSLPLLLGAVGFYLFDWTLGNPFGKIRLMRQEPSTPWAAM